MFVLNYVFHFLKFGFTPEFQEKKNIKPPPSDSDPMLGIPNLEDLDVQHWFTRKDVSDLRKEINE